VVGCSAEGTPDGEALGTTSQAYTGTFTPTATGTGTVTVPNDLQFMGEFKLNANQILIVGGYNAAGTGQTSAGILTNNGAAAGTWARLRVPSSSTSAPLPTALGEVEIAQISASQFLVAGGRPNRDDPATVSAWILTLNVSTAEATWTRKNMSQARVIGKYNLQKCGNTSHFIATGGITNDGMTSAGLPTVTDSIEVFHYDFTTPANSAWDTLRLGSNTAKTVKLETGTGYHELVHVSDTDLRVVGGATAAAEAVNVVGKVLVNSSCQALDTSVVSTSAATPVIKTSASAGSSIVALPAVRARMSSIQQTGTVRVAGQTDFDYTWVLATGNDANRFANAPPTRVFFYDPAASSGNGAFYNLASAKNLAVGRVFGRLVEDDTTAGRLKVGTGVIPDDTSDTLLYNTTTSVDTITTLGVIGAGTAMANSRVGAAVQLLTTGGRADFAALGTKYTAGASAAQVDVEDF